MGPGLRRGDVGESFEGRSIRRQHLVAAVIGPKLPTALPSDRGAAHGGGGILRDAERTVQAVGAAAAGGKRCAGPADAEHQEQGGKNFDHQSHGSLLPTCPAAVAELQPIITPNVAGTLQLEPLFRSNRREPMENALKTGPVCA